MTTDPGPNALGFRRLVESASDNSLPVIATTGEAITGQTKYPLVSAKCRGLGTGTPCHTFQLKEKPRCGVAPGFGREEKRTWA